MCERLGTELILAGSAQAKGRVERAHGTHQDRLVKKLRLAGIDDYAAANGYLRHKYWPEHNRRFAVQPAETVDFHEAVPAGVKLDEVFSLEYERTVYNDWVVRHENRYFQLEEPRRVQPGTKVTIRIRRNGRMEIVHEGGRLRWRECEKPKLRVAAKPPKPRRPAKHIPAADHPWRNAAVARAGA
jgi:hypothetical protein